MRLLLRSLAVVSALTLSLVAHADTFTGTVSFTDTSGVNNDYNFTGSFQQPSFNKTVTTPTTFTDALTITYHSVNCGWKCVDARYDDVSVAVDFTSPNNNNSGFIGTGTLLDGRYDSQTGVIDWNNNGPITLTFSDGSSAQISLPDFDFSVSNNDGSKSGTQDLTVKLIPAAATPEPSSLALLGTGVLGAAGMIRRRYSL